MMTSDYYIFTGERVPDHITHVLIAKALNFVRARAFHDHPNIQEVICHDGVEKIEKFAFNRCPRLLRVIMPGVKEIEAYAFCSCGTLSYLEWGKLEIIGEVAFQWCKSLSSIDLPSIKTIERYALSSCSSLTNAKFGKELESIGVTAFYNCTSLQRITLPLKDGMLTYDNIFKECEKLDRVDLVEGVHETVSALLLEEWKNDMNEEIHAINRILVTRTVDGGKAQAIRTWIRSVLSKIIHYKAEHRRCLNVAAAALQSSLPNDILFKSIFPFIELPSHTFEGES